MFCGLVRIRMTPGVGVEQIAPLGDGREATHTRFDAWWNETVTRDTYDAEFSRRSYVLGFANQDGGGHVDPTLSEAYARLTRHNSIGTMYMVGAGPLEPLGSPIPTAVRQITYEVLETLTQLGYAGV